MDVLRISARYIGHELLEVLTIEAHVAAQITRSAQHIVDAIELKILPSVTNARHRFDAAQRDAPSQVTY